MSNEPLPAESGPASSPAPANRAADAALMLAAVERMEAVVRGERATFDRLRADLDDMASTVALAKAALATLAIKPDGTTDGKSDNVIALLETIEGRVNAMVEFIGAPAEPAMPDSAAAPTPEAELAVTEPVAPAKPVADAEPAATAQPSAEAEPIAATEPAATAEAVEPEHAPVATVDDTPSVAMLRTMVEALAASMPATPTPDPLPPEPPESETARSVPEPEPTAATPEPVHAEAEPPPAARPIMPDLDLMMSFEQVAAMPVLPSDIGTAVIFTAKAPELAMPEQTVAIDPQPEAAPEALPPAEVTAAATSVEPPPEESSSDEDPAEFLYEPDPDPAADLLEPITFVPQSRSIAATSAQPVMAALPAVAIAMPEAAAPVDLSPPSRPAAEPAVPHDPLAPLRNMSDEEKIALFG